MYLPFIIASPLAVVRPLGTGAGVLCVGVLLEDAGLLLDGMLWVGLLSTGLLCSGLLDEMGVLAGVLLDEAGILSVGLLSVGLDVLSGSTGVLAAEPIGASETVLDAELAGERGTEELSELDTLLSKRLEIALL